MNLANASDIRIGSLPAKAAFYGNSKIWSQATFDPLKSYGLFAFYAFNDDGAGGLSLQDSGPNNITLTNALNEPPAVLGQGKIGGAAEFFPTGAVSLEGTTPFFILENPFTFSAWVYYTNSHLNSIETNAANSLFYLKDSNFQPGITISLLANRELQCFSRDVTIPNQLTENLVLKANNFMLGDQWMHICLIRRGINDLVVYRNGTEFFRQLTSSTTPPRTGLGRTFSFGSATPPSSKFDAFGLWDRALTPQEVSRLYNNGAGFEI